MASQGEAAAARSRSEAFADASEGHYQDETRPVSTPGANSGVSVDGAEQDFTDLQRRLTREQEK